MVKIIGHPDLYVVDCKASSWSNQWIDRDGGIYCFSNDWQPSRYIKAWVLNPPTPLQNIFKPTQALVELPEGFEMPLGSIWQDPDTKKC